MAVTRSCTRQQQANRLLAKNLVRIKPMVDTKMPVSYANKAKQRQKALQQESVYQSVHNRSVEVPQRSYQPPHHFG